MRPWLLVVTAGLLLGGGAALGSEDLSPSTPAPLFIPVEMDAHEDFPLAILESGGTVEELHRLCEVGLCQPLGDSPAPVKEKKDEAPQATGDERSKLALLKKLQRKVSKALSNLKTPDPKRGALEEVHPIDGGYHLRYQGGQTLTLPRYQSPVAWFGLARNDTGEIVAVKYLDTGGKRHRLALIGQRLRPVRALQGTVTRGAFASTWTRAGGAPELVPPVQEAIPAVNLAKIHRGFSFLVLLGVVEKGGDEIPLAISLDDPQPTADQSHFEVTNHRAVRLEGRYVSPDASNFVAENWPVPLEQLEILEDRLVLVTPRTLSPKKPVKALTRGRVSHVNKSWWLMSIDYDNGYSILYDGVTTDLKVGSRVEAGEVIGEAPYGTVVIRAGEGRAPVALTGNSLAFRRGFTLSPGSAIRSLFESHGDAPSREQQVRVHFWNFLLDFFDTAAFPTNHGG